jgi:hypothetical protein
MGSLETSNGSIDDEKLSRMGRGDNHVSFGDSLASVSVVAKCERKSGWGVYLEELQSSNCQLLSLCNIL